MNANPDEWLKCRTKALKSAPMTRLFCLPWAGGSSAAYIQWGKLLEPYNIEVWTLEYPARLARIQDSMCSTMDELVRDIAHSIDVTLSVRVKVPVMLYGHSMGGSVCYELAQKMKHKPDILFLSASKSPSAIKLCFKKEPSWRSISHELAIERLRKKGGTPEEVLAHKELMDMLLPSVIADFDLLQEYHEEIHKQTELVKIDCELVLLYGIDDQIVLKDDMEGWVDIVDTGNCSVQSYPIKGDHFFLKGAEMNKVLKVVVDRASAWCNVHNK
eukprot:CFRG2307T1